MLSMSDGETYRREGAVSRGWFVPIAERCRQ
jgi:hypothetical protein